MVVQALAGPDLAQRLSDVFPGAIQQWDQETVWVNPQAIPEIAAFLRDEPDLDFQFLNSISAVDYIEYFEVVYHLTSLQHQHTLVLKTRLYGRDSLSLPSVFHLWRGADFQEREIWDLMGIHFEGHPNMKRIMLWEGFEGHPLRKDFL
ncbi:MAG: NADH-quinone oxidoreductase subunit C [Dehalococcoidia bacterium]